MPPRVSIVLPVKNGMPHLQASMEAVRRQTYPHVEVLVQDGGSSDGTLDYLASLAHDLPALSVVSEPDSGIGQAYGRGLRRSTGDLVCFAAADEQLEVDALANAVEWFARVPQAVFVNGSVRMIDAANQPVQIDAAGHFDLIAHMKCEVVLAFAGLLNRHQIGEQLYYDESLKTCPDYDFWIRLGARFEPSRFVAVNHVFKTARADRASMSFRSESFAQFCADKLSILNRFLDAQPPGPVVEALRRSSTAGIYAWAAESVLELEGASPAFMHWCRQAAGVDPWSPRLRALSIRTAAFTVDRQTGAFFASETPQPEAPVAPAVRVDRALALDRAFSLPHWTGARVERGTPTAVHTGSEPWTFAAEIPFTLTGQLDAGYWYWARLDVEVLSGQVAIGPVAGYELAHEHTAAASHGRKTVFVKISRPETTAIMIRNSGLTEPAHVHIFDASVVRCARQS